MSVSEVNNSRPVRVRFAPSPTGPLHPGGVRTALFNYLFAKKHGGTNILRIEDTDQTRFVEGAEQFIIDSLSWCGVTFDEGVHVGGPHGPYRQSERKPMYRAYADQLIESGHAYYAFDTPEELDKMRADLNAQGIPNAQYNAVTRSAMQNSLSLPKDEVDRRLQAGQPFVIRFKIPRKEEVRLHDEIRGWVQFSSSQLDDKVLFKSDGMPTYHLANVVDDYLMQITHVIRGEEWLPSAPLHVLLYRAFGWEEVMPKFAHLPLLLRPDGNGKLSKRDGDRLGFPFYATAWRNPETGETTNGYRENGFLHEAYINFLAFLGWNPGTQKEIFSMDELIEAFSLERVGKHGARYDFEKLMWYNHQYIKATPSEQLATEVLPSLESRNWVKPFEYTVRVWDLLKERTQLLSDFFEQASYFYETPTTFEPEVVAKAWKENTNRALQLVLDEFLAMPPTDWQGGTIEAAFQNVLQTASIKAGEVMRPYRLAISGQGTGPAVWDMTELLGQKEVVARLAFALKTIQQA